MFLFTLFTVFIMSSLNIAAQPQKQKDMTIDAKVRAEVIKVLLEKLNNSYVFAEVAKKMEADIQARLKNKEYDNITSAKEFALKLTNDLQSVSKDKHMRVRFSERPLPVREDRAELNEEEQAKHAFMMKINNHGFEQVEWMPGNIGYIKFRGFLDPELGAETVAAAMNFVSNTDALIFDMRENGGGNPAMVAHICSYLFGDKPVHLNDLYWREGDKTEEFWTNPQVSGKKYLNKDVYVLTSDYTFSGAEEFSNNLKVLKRATIVGETTGGGANPGGMFRLNDNFGVFIPTGRAINPITKSNWEGTGVEPDVKVSKELALKTAYLLALNKSLERAKNDDMKNALKQIIEKNQKGLEELKKETGKK